MEIIVIIAYGIMLVGGFLLECLWWVVLAVLAVLYGLIQAIVEKRKEKKQNNSSKENKY
jgi:hypothetical protein